MIEEREWNSGLAEGNLFITWASIVGAEIAKHATPISILDSTLTIQTSSTAWATQLTLVADNLLATIQRDPSGATIQKLRFIGPQAPSWKKGVRVIRNARGPRDTYG
jgi:predicted nucleic acid-binding Zn ribbon protein